MKAEMVEAVAGDLRRLVLLREGKDALDTIWRRDAEATLSTLAEKFNFYVPVEKEIPDNPAWHKDDREYGAYCAGHNDLILAGYKRVIPLSEILKEK